jgi:hypothetical protein
LLYTHRDYYYSLVLLNHALLAQGTHMHTHSESIIVYVLTTFSSSSGIIGQEKTHEKYGLEILDVHKELNLFKLLERIL